MDDKLKYERIVLKISGEALAGNAGYGIDETIIQELASEIRDVHQFGVQVAVVLGGGNIFRGISAASYGMNRAEADMMGMLATIMNSLALFHTLERLKVKTNVMSALHMDDVAEYYDRRRAISLLTDGAVIILGGGTGNPFFTTDTAAALRAFEIGAKIVFKATKVDGVYSADPITNPDAVRYEKLSYEEMLIKNLKVMDTSAVSICSENKIPILVFNLFPRGNILRAVKGEKVGTIISNI